MSSPKRAAKTVAKTAAKVATKTAAKSAPKAPRHGAAARPALKAVAAVPDNAASADAKRVAATLEQCIVDGKLDVVSVEALQKLFAAASRVYTARVESGEKLVPVPRNSISATDVMVTASGLLKAADLAVFELGMWQSWTGR
jgi:hypothetical protein